MSIMDDWGGWEALTVLVAIVVLTFLVVVVVWPINWYSCHSRAEKMGFQAEWGPVTGCMIQVRGEWVPLEKYRVID